MARSYRRAASLAGVDDLGSRSASLADAPEARANPAIRTAIAMVATSGMPMSVRSATKGTEARRTLKVLRNDPW
jgi:hypothetical protein